MYKNKLVFWYDFISVCRKGAGTNHTHTSPPIFNFKTSVMKKATLTLLATIIAAVVLPAQAQYLDPSLAIKGGLNYSKLYIDEAETEDGRVGFHAGIAANFPVSEVFSIQPELLYSTRGVEAEYDINNFEGENEFNLNYIDLPLMLKFKFAGIFNIHAGGYAGYLIDANVSTTNQTGTVQVDLDTDDFNRWDYGVSAGLGVEVWRTEIGARYNLGLSEIADNTVLNTFAGDSKNVFLQLYAALKL